MDGSSDTVWRTPRCIDREARETRVLNLGWLRFASAIAIGEALGLYLGHWLR